MAIRVLYPIQCCVRNRRYQPYPSSWDVVTDLMNQTSIFNSLNSGMFNPTSVLLFKLGSNESDDQKPSPPLVTRRPFLYRVRIRNFSPDNIQVKVDDRKVLIEATKEEHANDGLQSHTRRHFCRSLILPDDVDADRVTSKMNENGFLEITAPRMANNEPVEMDSVDATVSEKLDTNTVTNASSIKPTDDQTGNNSAVAVRANEVEDQASSPVTDVVEKAFFRKIDIRGFSPDDVQVKTVGRKVTVTAKKVEKQSFAGIESQAVRQIYQSFMLPENVNSEHVTSQVNEDGYLELTAQQSSVGAGGAMAIDSPQPEATNVVQTTRNDSSNVAINEDANMSGNSKD